MEDDLRMCLPMRQCAYSVIEGIGEADCLPWCSRHEQSFLMLGRVAGVCISILTSMGAMDGQAGIRSAGLLATVELAQQMLPGMLRNPYKKRSMSQQAWKRALVDARRDAGEALGKGASAPALVVTCLLLDE